MNLSRPSRYPRRRKRRGFSLIELLCTIILLGAFAIIAGRLFNSTFHLYYDTAEAQNQTASIDGALTWLRADVWSAKRIDVSDPHKATMTMPDNRVIIWTIHADDLLRNEGDTNEKMHAPPKATFATDGVALTLHVAPAANVSAVDEIQMPSEMNVLEKLTR